MHDEMTKEIYDVLIRLGAQFDEPLKKKAFDIIHGLRDRIAVLEEELAQAEHANELLTADLAEWVDTFQDVAKTPDGVRFILDSSAKTLSEEVGVANDAYKGARVKLSEVLSEFAELLAPHVAKIILDAPSHTREPYDFTHVREK
jgi:hypothetical protein